MKKIFFMFLVQIVSISILGQKLEFADFELRQSFPDWVKHNSRYIEYEKSLVATRSLNPFYLENDFNGDRILDIAISVEEKSTGKRGILIIHGQTFDTYLVGAGNDFAHVGDDLKFVEIWKVYREREVWLTTFDEDGGILGSEMIKIDNDAITVSKSESASNLIVWQKDKYVWLHTGD
jgi:hypothetical protein